MAVALFLAELPSVGVTLFAPDILGTNIDLKGFSIYGLEWTVVAMTRVSYQLFGYASLELEASNHVCVLDAVFASILKLRLTAVFLGADSVLAMRN